MSYKVIRKNGAVVCFGPNDENYSPSLKQGELVTIEDIAPAVSYPIDSVSPAQMREALFVSGLLDQVEAAVSSGGRKLQIWWEFATQFDRTNPMVLAMADSLSISGAQLDDLFTLAASL